MYLLWGFQHLCTGIKLSIRKTCTIESNEDSHWKLHKWKQQSIWFQCQDTFCWEWMFWIYHSCTKLLNRSATEIMIAILSSLWNLRWHRYCDNTYSTTIFYIRQLERSQSSSGFDWRSIYSRTSRIFLFRVHKNNKIVFERPKDIPNFKQCGVWWPNESDSVMNI